MNPDLFLTSALLIIIIFYSIYFIKLLSQKRQGIQTNQLGKKQEPSVRIIEKILQFSTICIVPVQICSIFFAWSLLPDTVRVPGILIGTTGDLLFLISVLTMKNSWRAGIPEKDKTEFISHGIYHCSRNPAFLGFDLMYIGILVLYFNFLLLVITVFTIVMLHLQILQEEKYLETTFGEVYFTYKKNTRRYL